METLDEKTQIRLGLERKMEVFWTGRGYEDKNKVGQHVDPVGLPGIIILSFKYEPARGDVPREKSNTFQGVQFVGKYPRFTHYCLGPAQAYQETQCDINTMYPILFLNRRE